MNIKEGFFSGVDGMNLYYREFEPNRDPIAVTIVVHGHGDHSGGLKNLYEPLVENGFITYAFDLRGHGKSPGVRGFIRKWEEYRGDLHEFRRFVGTQHPHLPLFVIGHSLGGAISLEYSLFEGSDLAGIVAISPAVSYEITRSEKILVSLLGKIKPNFNVEKSGDIGLLTKDPDVIKLLESDHLRHNTITPGLGMGLMQALTRLKNHAENINLPFLLMFGLEDEITPPEKLRQFFEAVGSVDKKKIEYETLRHRPFDDLGRELFLEDLLGWLHEQTAKLEIRLK